MEDASSAIAQLRSLLPVGSTVWTVLRHRSKSGMSRSISTIICRDGEPADITYLLVRAGLGRFDQVNGGIKVSGAGMDMGFHLVYNLSSTLYPGGTPANANGGYALTHRWL